MPKFAANLTMLFTELPFMQRFEAAAQAGFKAVEYLFPYDYDKKELAAALRDNALAQVLHNLPAGNWEAGERGIGCHPDRVGEFREGVSRAIDYATALGCPQVNCLHGDLMQDRWLAAERACCRAALKPGTPEFIAAHAKQPVTCASCGNMRRPGVVWFGEQLPEGAFEAATEAARQCAVMLVVGTAGAVYPAASLAGLARGNGKGQQGGAKVVVINPHASELDHEAHLCLRGTAAQLLPAVLDEAP